jgi:hypothetical protein
LLDRNRVLGNTGAVYGIADADNPVPTERTFTGKNPKDSELGNVESELINGIAHSDKYWFWSNQSGVQRVPRSSGFTNWDKSVDIPLSIRAWDDYIPATETEPDMSVHYLGYDHYGDCDFYNGKLYIPLTSHDGYPPILLVYDENLNLLQWGKLGHGGGAWVAVNPVEGKLYTSDSFKTLKIYDLDTFTKYTGNTGTVNNIGLGYFGEINTFFTNAPGRFNSWWNDAWVQGGAFGPNGVFYYVVDHATDEDSDYTGVHAFEMTPLPVLALSNTDVLIDAPAYEIDLSGSFMHITYDSWMNGLDSRNGELEGVDVLTESDHYEILVQYLHNEADDDDVSLYHYEVK